MHLIFIISLKLKKEGRSGPRNIKSNRYGFILITACDLENNSFIHFLPLLTPMLSGPSTTTEVKPSLVYCLFPVPMFSENRGGREVIIDY